MVIDEAKLDELRFRGDPEADAVARDYLDSAEEMFKGILRVKYAETPEDADDRLLPWFEAQPPLPEWADDATLQRGVEFFEQWGIQLGLGLFLSSLPLAYASHDGVQVLALTAELETDTKRRVLESAQFVLDVTMPDGLQPGEIGYVSARHVRLMHAGVRHLIETHDGVEKTADPSVHPRWDPEWGTPINQEHLLGAMLSFSSSLLHVLDRLNLDYDPGGAEAYCHLWNVVGHLLGIDPDLLPLERAEMDELEILIRERNEAPSEAGRKMNDALIELVQSFVRFGVFKGVPVSTMRLFIGDDTADVLGAPPADWTRILIGALTSEDGRISKFLSNDPIARAVTKALSKQVLVGFVEHEREGGRPSFEIPTHLGSLGTPGATQPIKATRRSFKVLRSKLSRTPA